MKYYNLKDVEEREMVPGFKARFVHSETMTYAYWNIAEGSSLPAHSHHHEQVLNMLEGTFEFTVDGETRELNPGDVVVIPSNAEHTGKAVTDCRILDVFHPVREDYR